MDATSRDRGALSLPNQLSLRVIMGLFTFCWLLGAEAKLGFCVSILSAWAVGLSLGWMPGLRVLALSPALGF